MATQYLDKTGYVNRSVLPLEFVDDIEAVNAAWLDTQLLKLSSKIDGRLIKRYVVPFDAVNPPEKVLDWIASMLDRLVMLRRGVDPLDAQFQEIRQQAEDAEAELREAADSDDGLFELPLRSTDAATGVSKGGPLSYSESNPYEWTDVQCDKF